MPFNRLNHNVLGEIRPRFRLKSNLSIEEITSSVKISLENDPTVLGNVHNKYFVLKIPTSKQHYWSPELQVHLEKDEDSDDTILRCLVGPKQSVWAMFMFFYISIVAITFFGGMYGLVQMQMGKPNNMVYIIPVGLLILPSIYTFSKIGQKSGRDQMLHLISFLYHSVDSKGNVERIES